MAVRPLLHVTHSQSCGRAISPVILCFALFCDEKLRADVHRANNQQLTRALLEAEADKLSELVAGGCVSRQRGWRRFHRDSERRPGVPFQDSITFASLLLLLRNARRMPGR